jgi:hypothetical protein
MFGPATGKPLAILLTLYDSSLYSIIFLYNTFISMLHYHGTTTETHNFNKRLTPYRSCSECCRVYQLVEQRKKAHKRVNAPGTTQEPFQLPHLLTHKSSASEDIITEDPESAEVR